MFQQTPLKRVQFPHTLQTFLLSLLSMATILYGGFAFHTPKVFAATDNTVNFQARLEGPGGAIAADGYYNIEFKLYNGAGTNLWTEDYYDANGPIAGQDNRAKVVNGYITVSLGSQTAFPTTINWDQTLTLGMNVGGTNQTATPTYDGEMTPRLGLTATPYAFRAGQLAQGNAAGTFTSTLGLVQPTVGNQIFQLADQAAAGTYTVCIQGAANAAGGCAASTGGAGYIQNTTTQQSANFNIAASSGIAATIQGASGADIADFLTSGGSKQVYIDSGGVFRATSGGTISVSSGSSATALGVTAINTNTASSSAATTNAYSVNLNSSTNAGGGINTLNGILLGAVATRATSVYNGLYFGTGYNSLINYNGASIIDGTGILQSASLTGTYSSALTLSNNTNVYSGASLTVSGTAAAQTLSAVTSVLTPSLDTGSAGILSVGSTNATGVTITPATTINNSLAVTQTGNANVFSITGSTVLLTADTTSSRITIGSVGGCISNAGKFCVNQNNTTGSGVTNASNVFSIASTAATTNYNQRILINDTSSAKSNINYGIYMDNTGTTNTAAKTNGIYVNDPSGYGGGNLIQLQSASSDVFTVSNAGAAAFTGNLTQSTGVISLTGNATSQISTTSGALTLDAAAAVNIGTGNATSINIGKSSGSNAQTIINGTTIIKPNSGNESATAFQIQNAAGTALLSADTTAAKMGINTGVGALNVIGIANPTAPTLATVGTTGSLAAATYYYKLAAQGPTGIYTAAITSSPASVTTSGSASKNTLSWSAVTSATGYIVYRSTNGTTWFSNTVAAGTTSLIDNGSTYTWATSASPNADNLTGGVNLQSGTELVLDGGSGNYLSDIQYFGANGLNDLDIGNYNAGGSVSLSGDNFYFQDTTGYNHDLQINNSGQTLFQNRVNSTTAFQVQNAAGSSFLTADSTNQIITTKDHNVGSASNSGSAGRLFSDGFESGNFKLWSGGTISSGSSVITADTSIVRNGKYSAKLLNNNGASDMSTAINGGTTTTFRGYIYIASTTGNVDLLNLSTTSYAFGLTRNNTTGKLAYYNTAGSSFADTTGTLTTGAWHEVEMDITANTSTGSFVVYLDGTNVLNLTNQNTGNQLPISLLIGDGNTGRSSTTYFDDIVADSVRPGDSSSLNVSDSLHIGGSSSFGGGALFQAASNSTTAFQVQNSAGTSNSLVVDTVNNQVNVGGALSVNAGIIVTNPGTYGITLTGATYSQSGGDFLYNSSTGQVQETASVYSLSGASNPLIFATNANNLNLVNANAGFEQASTTNWGQEGAGTGQSVTLFGTPVYANPIPNAFGVYDGRWSGLVTTASGTANTGIQTTSFTASLTSATAYTLTFYARASGSTISTLRAGMAYNGSTETACTLSSTTVTTTGFQRYSCSFTTGTISGSPYLFIGVSDTTQHIFYLDDVQLTAGSVATPYDNGSVALTGRQVAPTTFQNASDSTTAFQIQNAAGTSNLFVADTLNNALTLGGSVNASTLNVGAIGTAAVASTSHISDSTGNAAQIVSIGSITSASSTTTIQGGTGTSAITIQTGANGTTNIDTNAVVHTINIGTGAAAQSINVGSTNTVSKITLNGGFNSSTGGVGVTIGSSTADANQVNLQLDTSSTYAETGSTCAATVNQGAMYYNSTSGAIRGCVNANWEDIVTTSGMGIILYGVVPDSGTSPGDLAGTNTTLANQGPCRVYMGTSTTSIGYTGCTAYSGGRKVIVPAVANVSLGTITSGNWYHVCLNGTSGAVLITSNASETGGLPAFSAGSPIMCLADVKLTGTVIGGIYDTRVYTTDDKQFITLATATGLSTVVKLNAVTAGNYAPTTNATGDMAQGVVVAYSGTTSTTAINGIIVTQGPISIKATSGLFGNFLQTGNATTNGYALTAGAVTANAYQNLGIAQNNFSTSCSANSDNCRSSLFINLNIK